MLINIFIKKKKKQVLPGLYLGSYDDMISKIQIERNKITHILSIHDMVKKQEKNYNVLYILKLLSKIQKFLNYF